MIDAHVHVWDLDVRDQPWIPAGSPVRRTFTLDDLRATIAPTPVERVVLVQVINDAGRRRTSSRRRARPTTSSPASWAGPT